jgi:hypothetical protein
MRRIASFIILKSHHLISAVAAATGERRSIVWQRIAAWGSTTMTETATTDNVIPRADIVKRAARLCAEIRNIKLSGDLSDQTIRAINKVLLEHKGIFFRD